MKCERLNGGTATLGVGKGFEFPVEEGSPKVCVRNIYIWCSSRHFVLPRFLFESFFKVFQFYLAVLSSINTDSRAPYHETLCHNKSSTA